MRKDWNTYEGILVLKGQAELCNRQETKNRLEEPAAADKISNDSPQAS